MTEMVFRDHLDELIRDRFGPENYHLLSNNCNSLTKILWRFLGNGDVPSDLALVELSCLTNPYPFIVAGPLSIVDGPVAVVTGITAILAGLAGSTSSGRSRTNQDNQQQA